MAEASGISKSTLFRSFKRGIIKRKSSTLKPRLNDGNKLEIVKFVKKFIQNGKNGKLIFNGMYDRVHIDEKWFYMTKTKKKILYSFR